MDVIDRLLRNKYRTRADADKAVARAKRELAKQQDAPEMPDIEFHEVGKFVWRITKHGEKPDPEFGARMSGGNANPARKAKRKATAKAEAKQAAEPEPEPEPEPVPEGVLDHRNPMPHDGKPYSITARLGTDELAHRTHTVAFEVSKMLRHPVEVHDKDGNHVGTIDATKFKPERAARKGGGGRRAANPDAGPNKMLQAAIDLAERKEGVTREQLKAVSDKQQPWTMLLKGCARFGYRYWTTEAPKGGSSRTVYHLERTTS